VDDKGSQSDRIELKKNMQKKNVRSIEKMVGQADEMEQQHGDMKRSLEESY
jgi:hypothetical protein